MHRLFVFIAIFVFFVSSSLFGNDYLDVVYLKNGSVAKGVIIENVPNEYVKLEIQGGTILTFKYADIEKFAKEKNSQINTEQSKYSFTGSNNINGIQGGIKAGINMGKFIGDDTDLIIDADQKYLLGFTIGGFLSLKINDRFIFRPELLYTVKGSRYKENWQFFYWEHNKAKYKMNYIDCCILGIIPIHNNESLLFGPSIGFYLNGKVKYTYMYEDRTESEDIEKDDIESPDFGLTFGVSYRITPNIEIEPRYYLGLKSWEKKESEEDDYKYDIRHSAFQLMMNFYL